MGLDKLQIFVNPNCRGAVKSLRVDGKAKGATFAWSDWDTTADLPRALQPPAFRPLLFKVTADAGVMHTALLAAMFVVERREGDRRRSTRLMGAGMDALTASRGGWTRMVDVQRLRVPTCAASK